ncbi:hypothetical protein BDV96DRAFT_262901 [Lophiotrema nucula]|uniref:BTB domain-containing protein n=1 Tax=Lophiotrema nucula TaxID=690887 RepID=A0A6A5YMH3_9PLEO|nr:hypothetical protein BDV96DRAFT_262901 [Lophiotrema nucula]
MTVIEESTPQETTSGAHGESPYRETGIVYLDVGADRIQFGLHRNALSKCEVLSSKLSPQSRGPRSYDTVALPELDEPTAHTLVHYLYSGQYETQTPEHGTANSYKLGTCVYCAAVRYKLPGLADLAKHEITGLGEDTPIVDILSVARDVAFPTLPVDEQWYSDYVEGSIKRTASGDPSFFTTPAFVSQIGGHERFKEVVVRAMVESLSKAPSVPEPQKDDQDADAKLGEVKVDDTPRHDNVAHEAIEEHSSMADTAVPEPEISEAPQEESLAFDSVEPSVVDPVEPVVVTPAKPEPATDELGYGNSKTYQKYGKKVGDVPITVSVDVDTAASKEENRPAHKRADSAVQVADVVEEAPVQVPIVEDKVEQKVPAVEALASPSTEEVVADETAAPAKKKKNKKHKNKGTTAPAPAVAV